MDMPMAWNLCRDTQRRQGVHVGYEIGVRLGASRGLVVVLLSEASFVSAANEFILTQKTSVTCLSTALHTMRGLLDTLSVVFVEKTYRKKFRTSWQWKEEARKTENESA